MPCHFYQTRMVCEKEPQDMDTKCVVTSQGITSDETKPQDEMYERYTEVKITSNQLLRPELYKEKMKVCSKYFTKWRCFLYYITL